MKIRQIYVRKTWGHELWFVNNGKYCGKKITIDRNKTSSNGRYHFHKLKDETFYIIKGKLILEYIDGEKSLRTIILRKGESFRLEPETPHRFSAGFFKCVFIETSTHHEDSDSYYIDSIYTTIPLTNQK